MIDLATLLALVGGLPGPALRQRIRAFALGEVEEVELAWDLITAPDVLGRIVARGDITLLDGESTLRLRHCRN